MEAAALSVSVSVICQQLLLKRDKIIKVGCKSSHSACVSMCIKITKTAGPRGLSGLTVLSPVDVEDTNEADHATASCRPVPAHRFKPAAAC